MQEFVAIGLGILATHVALALFLAHGPLPPGPWRAQPGYTAHQLISAVTMVYVTAVGGRAWFTGEVPSAHLLDRVLTRDPTGEYLAHAHLGFNLFWDLPVGFSVESLRTRSNAKLMVVHHVVMALLAWLALYPRGLFQHYLPFFFGTIEASSVPMSLMDLCHPRNEGWARLAHSSRVLAVTNAASRVAFAVTYLALRAVYFPYVVVSSVLPDVLALHALRDPPVTHLALRVILVAVIGLTALQLHWARLVVAQVVGAAVGKGAKAT